MWKICLKIAFSSFRSSVHGETELKPIICTVLNRNRPRSSSRNIFFVDGMLRSLFNLRKLKVYAIFAHFIQIEIFEIHFNLSNITWDF